MVMGGVGSDTSSTGDNLEIEEGGRARLVRNTFKAPS